MDLRRAGIVRHLSPEVYLFGSMVGSARPTRLIKIAALHSQ